MGKHFEDLECVSRSVVSDSLQPHGCRLLCPWKNGPEIKLQSFALQADFLPSEPPGKPLEGIMLSKTRQAPKQK